MPPLSNVHSASAMARPPSEQSCADSTHAVANQLDDQRLQRRLALEIQRRRPARDHAVHGREVFAAAELAKIIAQQHHRRAGAS